MCMDKQISDMAAYLERSRWLLRFKGDGEGERLLGERLHRHAAPHEGHKE